jgi:hypothetical protein
MTALSTRTIATRPLLAPPTALERLLLSAGDALQRLVLRRIGRRQALASGLRVDPAAAREEHVVAAWRSRSLR